MKQSLLLAFSVLVVAFSHAQITLDSSDIGHVGDKIYFGSDTAISGVTISAGSSTAQSWDFSGFVQDQLDSVEFVNPASTPNGVAFPSADIALSQDGGFAFLTKTNTELSLLGLEFELQGVVLPIRSNPSQVVLDFPSTYGSSINQTVVVDTTAQDIFTGLFDSIRLKRIITSTLDIDAFGSLTTPDSTYSDVLRQASTTTNIDSIWTYSALIGTWNLFLNNTTTEYRYQFFTNDAKIHVLELVTDAIGGNVTEAQYQLGSKPAASAVVIDVNCFGGNNGVIDQDVVGGFPPYSYQWNIGSTTQDLNGATAGTYTVTIYDQVDSTVYSYTITEPTELIVSGSIQDETFGNDGIVDITVSGGTPAYTFNWSDGSSNEDLTDVNADNYIVTVTDANGCTVVDGFTVGNNTSTNEINESIEISLFPNPVSDRLTLSVGKEVEITSVRVLNLLGSEMMSFVPEKNSLQINVKVQELTAGIYILEVASSKGKSTQKFYKN